MPFSILLARQPIFDSNLNTVAYELLYRNADGDGPKLPFDGTQATAEVLLHAYSSILQNGRIRTLPAFINFTAEWLYNGDLPAVSPDVLVLEVLEDVPVTPALVERLTMISEAGYKLALDDFMYDISWEPILNLARIVKIDIQQLSPTQLVQHIEELKKHNVTLLAEKVETHQEYEYCKSLGFKLFQGYFFCRPMLVEGRKISAGTATTLELINELDRDDATPQTVETIIGKDPELVLRLLKIVNSARFALSRKISSISEAVVALGLDELRKWALLINVTQNDGKPNELIRQILTCAHMCELCAPEYKIEKTGSAFMVGMLSGLNAILDLEMPEMLNQLPISSEINLALLEHKGPLGELLQDVQHYMQGEWDELSGEAHTNLLAEAQIKSLSWVLQTLQDLANQS